MRDYNSCGHLFYVPKLLMTMKYGMLSRHDGVMSLITILVTIAFCKEENYFSDCSEKKKKRKQ